MSLIKTKHTKCIFNPDAFQFRLVYPTVNKLSSFCLRTLLPIDLALHFVSPHTQDCKPKLIIFLFHLNVVSSQ